MKAPDETAVESTADTISNCLGEFREIRESKGEQAENRHCAVWPSGRHAWSDWR